MIRTLYALLTLALLASCAKSYEIEGSSNVPTLDGRMLFLKAYHDNDLKSIDSCDIVHGKFHFSGALDSAKLVTLFMDDESIMPVVLESGEITINIDNAQQKVSGTPLNDKLFAFIEKYNQLESEISELGHLQSQAIMDGKDLNAVNAHISEKAQQIAEREDKLITSFIVENFDNVLGPGVFFMMTAGHRYPELSPWIEDIMSKATPHFKNDPYVKDYYEKAQQNQAIMNGTAMPEEIGQMPPQTAPTPNEMAQPQADATAPQTGTAGGGTAESPLTNAPK
ncbi:MAG: DUF4369 domain-containing protein [Prevotellaceae bacterium]|nr:DUF4369 domain-containing protein [Prevotellaceae bacterium]